MKLRVAVVGASGAVGREMWSLLEASDIPISEVFAYTSDRSAGTRLGFRGAQVVCRKLSDDSLEPVQLVLASAGAKVSRDWSPRFVDAGAVVVDNSSAFRSHPDFPLVVPEINGHLLGQRPSIIANPNCSTIQMVMALVPLHREWGLRAVKVATYQSASGAGGLAMKELLEASADVLEDREPRHEHFPHPLAFNVIPHIGDFGPAGESGEELKMRLETRRILSLPQLPLSATCVRVPVLRGHSEAVWASFKEVPDPETARKLLVDAGIVVEDVPSRAEYPVPRAASGRHDVFVGRVRRDESDDRGLAFWVVSDNLLKGAATNAFQIAQALVNDGLLSPARS